MSSRRPLLLLAVSLFVLALLASATSADGAGRALRPARGDADCSGDISAVDALTVLRFNAHLPPTGTCLATADTNCDASTDSIDALNILRYTAGDLVLPAAACSAIGGFLPCGAPDLPQTGTYIALGDSLSAGVGASDPPATAFVPLVHDCLGGGYRLTNLGHSGDTSADITDHGHLDDALAEIQARNTDADPDNDVRLVTLEIGGNDLLHLFFDLVLTGKCPTVEASLSKAECTQPLHDLLDAYGPRLATILSRLQQADPNVTIVLVDLYNPFSGSIPVLSGIASLALEGLPGTGFPDGLNDIMRAQALAAGVPLADVYQRFLGQAPQLVSGDSIHPNDAGYRVIADAVLGAIGIVRSQ